LPGGAHGGDHQRWLGSAIGATHLLGPQPDAQAVGQAATEFGGSSPGDS